MGRAPLSRELSTTNVVGCYRLQPIQTLRPMTAISTRINSAVGVLLMTHETVGRSSLPKRRFPDWRDRVTAALAVLIVTAGTVHAEVRVNGDASALQVVATQSNVAEVLSALESAFQLRVKTPIVLDRAIGGTFTGPLEQILRRILEDYNYFIRWQETKIEVTVIGLTGDRAAVVQRPRPQKSPAMSLSEFVRLKNH
jgi:hypothetical protein